MLDKGGLSDMNKIEFLAVSLPFKMSKVVEKTVAAVARSRLIFEEHSSYTP